LTPTGPGRDLVRRATPAVLQMEHEVFAGVPLDHVQGLRLVLGQLEERLELRQAPGPGTDDPGVPDRS
jgi:hypothetical protein